MTDPALRDALSDLAVFVDAARPYLDQVVFVGGWVPYFYRFLPELRVPPHAPLLTRDFDLATPDRLALSGKRPLDELLRVGNFVVINALDPPVLRYQHRRRGLKNLAPIHFEFLASLSGRRTDRKGVDKALREVQPGLMAQRLRHIELLLHEPLEISLERVPHLHVKPPVVLRIPNPAAYLIQKGLIRGRRRAAKAGKDFAYVYEVALLWSGHEREVRAMVDSLSKDSRLWGTWVTRGRAELAHGFSDVAVDGPVSVEREFASARATPAVTAGAAFRIVRPFLEEALGVRSLSEP